jgi:ABC-2 type transport system permease protein
MRDLLQERELGQVDRLLASPTSMGAVIASKLISTLALLVACHLLLTAAGRLIFGIRSGDPVAALLLVICQGLAITGLMSFVFALTRTERQAGTLSTIVIFAMSIVGGSMIPTDALPGMAQKASPFTINYWAIEGFQKVMVLGEGVAAVAPHMAVLALFGLVTAVIGSLLFPRSLRR